jgi:hypothetical protein
MKKKDTTILKYFFIFADTIHFAWIFVTSILSRVFKLEVPSSLGSSSIYQRWIAENLAVIWPMEVFEWVNGNFLNNYEFWKGAKMLARGHLSENIFFAYFVFRGSIGIYQSVQTSRIVKKIYKSMHPDAHENGWPE